MPERNISPIVGVPPIIEWAPIAAINVDDKYQRSIESAASQKIISEIACNWDWNLFDPIRLSKRDDGLYVIDGQHRLAAAKLRGELPELPAIINIFVASDEARLFLKINTARKNPTVLDKFRARCAAGELVALAINGVITSCGLSVGKSTKVKDGEVVCVGLIERLYRRHGEKLMLAALSSLSEAYPGQGIRCAEEMLAAICLYLKAPTITKESCRDRLKTNTQTEWSLSVRRYHNDHPHLAFPVDAAHAMLISGTTPAVVSLVR